jgi:hypothetical protein
MMAAIPQCNQHAGIAYQIERRRNYAVMAQSRESACFLVKSANIFSLFFLYQKTTAILSI